MSKKRKEKFNTSARASLVPHDEGMGFLQAAKDGDLSAVTLYVEKYGVDGIDVRDRDWSPHGEPEWKTDRQTALMIAVWEKHADVVAYLIEQGANVNAQDKRGYTPLMLSHEPKMAALLLDGGADIEQKSKEGRTALMWPTTAEMIRFLAARGAKVDARDKEGRTALMGVAKGHRARGYATVEGNAAALLDAGADIHARDNDGRTALMHAAVCAVYSRSGHDEDDDIVARVDFFMEKGADPTLRDKQGNTAEMLARLERPDLDGNIAQQAAAGDVLAAEASRRTHAMSDMFTAGPAQNVGIMKPLALKK